MYTANEIDQPNSGDDQEEIRSLDEIIADAYRRWVVSKPSPPDHDPSDYEKEL